MKTIEPNNRLIIGRREFLAGAAAVAAAARLRGESADIPPGRFEMTVVNPEVVKGGCGLCVIMRTPSGRTYLFDAANGNDQKSNGKDIIIPWLEKRGISRIDGLILSHYHSDHFGGLPYLLDHFEVGHVFDNSFEPLNAYGNKELDDGKRCLFKWEKSHPGAVTRYLVEGDELGWNEPGVRFDVVWPPKTGYCTALDRGPDYKRNGSVHHLLNANSTALRIRVGDVDYLILGDINADYVTEYMRPYMERKGTWKADAVVLHCHGIPDDKGANIAAMKPLPKVAIASLGNLKWMLGAGRKSVDIYSGMGIKAYSTNLHGNVSVVSDGRSIDISTDSTKLFSEKGKAMTNAAQQGESGVGKPHYGRSVVSAGVLLFAAMCASAGQWQAVDGVWDGYFSDPQHWNGGFAQEGEENTIVPSSAENGLTVTVGEATNVTGRITFEGWGNRPAVLDVRGASLCFATQTVASAVWPGSAFYGRFDGYTFFPINSNDSRWNKQAQGLLSNAVVKIWSPEEGVAEMRVTGGAAGGIFDFAHPDPRGDTKAPTGARPTVNLFNANYYQPDKSSYNHCRFALENTTAYFPSVSLASFPTVAELALNGASVNVLGSFSSSCASNVFALTSGSRLSLTTGGWSTLGSSGATSVFQMEDDCELVTTKIPLSEDRQVVVTGGRLTPAATAFLELKDNSAMRLKNVAIVGTSETLFNLSGNARLEGEECALTNSASFTMKAQDTSKIDFIGGSLVTPEISCNIDEGMSVSNAVVGVKKWSGTKMRVELADCAFTSDSALDLTVSDGEMRLFNVTGVTAAAGIVQLVNSNVVTFAADDLSRTLILQSNSHGKIGDNKYGELNITGGTLEFRPSGGHRLNLATSSTGVGVLNLSGGRLVSKIAQNGSRTFGLGVTSGTGFINVSGGELDVSGLCFCTESNADAAESVFRQTGGLVKVAACEYEASCQSKGLCATGNNKTNRKARIALNGGETETSVIAGGTSGQCRGGTGWTAFEANGGYVRANGDGAHILRDFDEAKLGAKGLTVDANGHDLTIAQNLTSQAGDRGLLVLTGTGVKTIGGTNSVDIVAAGGTTSFAPGADCSAVSLVVTNGATVSFAAGGAKNRTFASLVLGDEGCLAFVNLKAGEPLTVTGDVTIKRLSLVLSGSFTTGQSYSLLTCGGTISEDSKAAWCAALANGLNADQGCDFVFEDDGQGNTTLKMSVRERANLTITVDAGATSNVAEAIMYSTSDTLTADVGAEGTLNVTGQAGYGALVKTGTGRATFGNAADLFTGGVTVQAGLLAFPYAAIFADSALLGSALTVGTGTLELGQTGAAPVTLVPSLVINTSAAADAAVVRLSRQNVTVAAPTVTQGCFVKRGAGTLTLETSGMCAFSSNAGTDVKNTAPHVTALSFDPFGIPPTDNYSSLTVAEGDLVLAGTSGAKYTTSGSGAVYVGMPVQGVEKPARLVVDGAEAEFKGGHFHVGSSVRTANCSQPNAEFVVTNGANVSVTSLRLGWNKDAAARPRVRVDGVGSVLYASEYFYLADNATSDLTEEDPQVLVTGGASLLMPPITDGNVYHAVVLQNNGLGVFDGSLLAAKDKKDARVRATGTGGELVFRNGAECRVSVVAVESDTTPLTLTFDDALWSFGDKLALTLTRPERVTVNARNKGIVFAPEAGTNLTFGLTVSGSGDLVKRGAGALTLDAAPTLTGVCRVEEGALALGSGVTASNLTLAGAGSLTAGTFADTTLFAPLGDSGSVTGAVPVIAGAIFTGCTRIDLARTTPIVQPYPKNVLVATYAGAAPDVSTWKIVNAETPRLNADFAAANGEIRMTLKASGFVLTVR